MSAFLRRRARFAIAVLVAALFGATGATAQARDMALGSNGEVYKLRSGLYSALFPGGTEASPDASVLALDVQRGDAPPQHLLVPGTEGSLPEGAATIFYENASNSLFVFWVSYPNILSPTLQLASYDGTAWSDVIQLTTNPFARKSSPQMVVTHDVYRVTAADGTLSTVQRTILHTLWAEDNSTGTQDTVYSPIIFDNGLYLGYNPLFRLNGLDPTPASATAAVPPDSLLTAPHLQMGWDNHTVLAAFADGSTRRIVAVELTALPRELSNLADDARAHIIGVGAKLFPGNLTALAADARAHIIGVGSTFQPEVIQSMASDAAAVIDSASPSNSLQSIADQARAHIIGIGARISTGGLLSISDAEFASSQQIADISGATPSGGASSTQLIRFSVVSSRPVPSIGSGQVGMYASQDGQKILLSWEGTAAVSYLETSSGTWSAVRQLVLGSTLDINAARQVLAQRALNQ